MVQLLQPWLSLWHLLNLLQFINAFPVLGGSNMLRCDFNKSRVEGDNQSFDLLLKQSHMLLAALAARTCFWLMFSLLSTKVSNSFSIELHPSQYIPSLYCWKRLFPPKCRSLLSFIRFLFIRSFCLLRSFWMTALSLSLSTCPPSLVSFTNLIGALCSPPSGHW